MAKRRMFSVCLGIVMMLAGGCDNGSSNVSRGSGGANGGSGPGGGSEGGSTMTGGASASGGSAGGVASSSGGRASSGGETSLGGAVSSGGSLSSGGAGTGGIVATGGRTVAGGTSISGGVAAGGSTISVAGGATASTGGNGGTAGGSGDNRTGGATGTGGSTTAGTSTTGLAKFSFFVTSIEAMRELSGSQDGFGGDLRFGEATGLAGADKICRTIAEKSMAGAGAKGWVAFLSATAGGTNGGSVNAIDRVGEGPWYDRIGRVVAQTKADLANTRPANCATAICSDLPNESGTPNHQNVDNHDVITGSNAQGKLASTGAGSTCNDWTSAVGATGKPMCGHSWPASSGQSWIAAHNAGGCAPGVNMAQTGGGGGGASVGAMGGYGGIYCFALQP